MILWIYHPKKIKPARITHGSGDGGVPQSGNITLHSQQYCQPIVYHNCIFTLHLHVVHKFNPFMMIDEKPIYKLPYYLSHLQP